LGDSGIEKSYECARERYARFGVDVDRALQKLGDVSLSIHCWQGDDVAGFERPGAALTGGGIQVTGEHPGRARTPDELRADLDRALSLIPGRHRINLHAMYGEFGSATVERDEIEPHHYQGWLDYARARGLGMDFNATCFSHPRASSGLTLSHRDRAIRDFWIAHIARCRDISAFLGRELGTSCIHNLWIPDGTKDIPADRWGHRRRLLESLDEIYATEHHESEMKDAVESKLFGIGSESFVVGSHDFYLGYALTRGKMLCLDLGHFHATESVADKISALLQFCDEVLLHVSRGVRWDSDHVPVLQDDLILLMEEVVRADALSRSHLALDFFDASMNRVGAWVIGGRSTLRAVLMALLQPRERLATAEEEGDNFTRLALREEAKCLPSGAVWDYHCLQSAVPMGPAWLEDVRDYGAEVGRTRT
jgi:L-rhamnose isomerase